MFPPADTDRSLTRRRLLTGVAAAVALAGCGGGDGGAGTTEATPTGTTAAAGGTDTTTMASEDLDLSEANVTGVAIEHRDGTEYRFEVTLHHDDDGEEGYANWWQVETLDGERLGRRELSHAHGTREFTRSATVDAGDATCVVVRGHDQTHGYGGHAMVVNLETGETEAVRQGPEPEGFVDYEGVC